MLLIEHLPRVQAPMDFVLSVSVRHQLALVTPWLGHAPAAMQQVLAIPPPLAPDILQILKKWYYLRPALRFAHNQSTTPSSLTQGSQAWHQIERMMTSTTRHSDRTLAVGTNAILSPTTHIVIGHGRTSRRGRQRVQGSSLIRRMGSECVRVSLGGGRRREREKHVRVCVELFALCRHQFHCAR